MSAPLSLLEALALVPDPRSRHGRIHPLVSVLGLPVTVGTGHGRVETRTLTSTTALNEYLRDWPGLAQVIRVERERRGNGVATTEVADFITSLDRSRADAARLPDLIRRHWGSRTRCTTCGT